MKKTNLLFLIVILLSFSISAQELKVVETSEININQLPEYVIITSQNTKLLGGIGIIIDSKKSIYRDQLLDLESILQDQNKLKVRNQTDLLNSMSKLGFEYVNSYNANAVMPSKGDDGLLLDLMDGGDGTYRVNMVFRKKEKFRN